MEALIEWLVSQPDTVVYLIITILLLTGAIGFPPEDVSLIAAGIAIQHGKVEPEVMFFICYFGTILGDVVIYSIGRKFGSSLFSKPWFIARVRPGRIKLIRKSLEKRSLPMIFIARHMFYFRTVTFATCGAVKMRFVRFLISDAFSALVSVPVMLWIGFQAAEHYSTIIGYISQAKYISLVVALVIIGVGAYLIRRQIKQAEQEVEK